MAKDVVFVKVCNIKLPTPDIVRIGVHIATTIDCKCVLWICFWILCNSILCNVQCDCIAVLYINLLSRIRTHRIIKKLIICMN